MRYDKLQRYGDEEFRRLTGIKRQTFIKIDKKNNQKLASERVLDKNVLAQLNDLKSYLIDIEIEGKDSL